MDAVLGSHIGSPRARRPVPGGRGSLRPVAPETGNLEKPGLGDLMSLVQIRHIKLWFAGRAQN